MMKLSVNSVLWRTIHTNIFKEHDFVKEFGIIKNKRQVEIVLAFLDINVITDEEGRWESIELNMSDEDLTLFLMRWA